MANGIYLINPDGGIPFKVPHIIQFFHGYLLSNKKQQVYCDMENGGGGWTVFQKRFNGQTDFYRRWIEYENGFGNLKEEFWLGLSKIHRLTKSGLNQLRVDLKDFSNQRRYATYSSFSIGGSNTNYTLSISGYSFSGTAGDSLTNPHNGRRFATWDYDHNICARAYHGAWWYDNCFWLGSNLNGPYHFGGIKPAGGNEGYGMYWYSWKQLYGSMKQTEMKIKP